MPVRVIVHEGADLAEVLRRFEQLTQMAYRRPWAKPRPGYYEKPGDIRRRRRMVRAMNARTRSGRLKFYWHWQKLWRRNCKLHGFLR
jgi:ribosomal protein S21